MFDNITRHFSLKGKDRVTIGTSIGAIDATEEKTDATPVDLNERDIDSIEIDDHAIIDDLIHADDIVEDIESTNVYNNNVTENENIIVLDSGDPINVQETNDNDNNKNFSASDGNTNESDDSDIEII